MANKERISTSAVALDYSPILAPHVDVDQEPVTPISNPRLNGRRMAGNEG
jgi:hypothetical protein